LIAFLKQAMGSISPAAAALKNIKRFKFGMTTETNMANYSASHDSLV
jgi:hypothetical protein